MTPAQFELLEAIYESESAGTLRSLFRVVAATMIDYRLGWLRLAELERRGLVEVERRQSPMPLRIATTELGRAAVIERRLYGQEALPEVI